MRKGPAQQDLPFGQVIFPETCQWCPAAVATASDIQSSPIRSHLRGGLPTQTSRNLRLFLLGPLKKKKKKASSGYQEAEERKAALELSALHGHHLGRE